MIEDAINEGNCSFAAKFLSTSASPISLKIGNVRTPHSIVIRTSCNVGGLLLVGILTAQ